MRRHCGSETDGSDVVCRHPGASAEQLVVAREPGDGVVEAGEDRLVSDDAPAAGGQRGDDRRR